MTCRIKSDSPRCQTSGQTWHDARKPIRIDGTIQQKHTFFQTSTKTYFDRSLYSIRSIWGIGDGNVPLKRLPRKLLTKSKERCEKEEQRSHLELIQTYRKVRPAGNTGN
jgi:hypothetical protein